MNIESSFFSFFLIKSAGRLDFMKGFIPAENSAFDPEQITELLSITPFDTCTIGTPKPYGKNAYNFSAWYGCLQTEPETDRFDQCSKIAGMLKPHISDLQKIKELYNVSFCIEVYPRSGNAEGIISFSHDVIELCYLTGTEIVVDMFCYETETDKAVNL